MEDPLKLKLMLSLRVLDLGLLIGYILEEIGWVLGLWGG